MGVAALWFFGLLVVIVDIAATVDVIRRPDLGGGAKVLWVLLIFILPVLGVIAYVIARPSVVDFGGEPRRSEEGGLGGRGRASSRPSEGSGPDRNVRVGLGSRLMAEARLGRSRSGRSDPRSSSRSTR